jgi:pimeloyl-ACP methyl ester carboxylesterase
MHHRPARETSPLRRAYSRTSPLRRALCFALGTGLALGPQVTPAQDLEREARWRKETLAALDFGEAIDLVQKSGHRVLTLHTPAMTPQPPRGALIIAHGRGWGPNFELYRDLRIKLAEAGWTTLSLQLPVLPSTAKIGDYVPTYPDAAERFELAAQWLAARGHRRIAIVSHSLGATMANYYLSRATDGPVRAWVFIGIINGLEDMVRIRIPVLDIFGGRDWDVTRVGADERRRQIERIAGSRQVMVSGAQHFFEGQQDRLVSEITAFLEVALAVGGTSR